MSQPFADYSVDWSNFLLSPPPSINSVHNHHHLSTTTDQNPISFSFDSAPPTLPPTTTKSTLTAPRVTKPVRKRSRASRRTPTTLLSTDTSNFRAMVQQFTGGQSSGLGFGINREVTTASVPFPGSHSLQFHQQDKVIGMGSSLRSHVSSGNYLNCKFENGI